LGLVGVGGSLVLGDFAPSGIGGGGGGMDVTDSALFFRRLGKPSESSLKLSLLLPTL